MSKDKQPKSNYPYIRAWGMYLKSFGYYIEEQVLIATNDGAPLDAVYRRDSKWVRLRDIENLDLAKELHIHVSKVYGEACVDKESLIITNQKLLERFSHEKQLHAINRHKCPNCGSEDLSWYHLTHPSKEAVKVQLQMICGECKKSYVVKFDNVYRVAEIED